MNTVTHSRLFAENCKVKATSVWSVGQDRDGGCGKQMVGAFSTVHGAEVQGTVPAVKILVKASKRSWEL